MSKKKSVTRFMSVCLAVLLAAQSLPLSAFAKDTVTSEGVAGIVTAEEDSAGSATEPSETQIPEQSTVPPETQIPEQSTVPPETQVPEESTVPSETQMPEESTVPSETQIPEESTAAPEPQLVELAAFLPLPAEQSKLSVKPGTPFSEIPLPDKLEATDLNGAAQTVAGVTWSCPAYQEDGSRPGNTYHAAAVLPEGYRIAEGVRLPEITLIISGPVPRTINDRIVIGGAVYKEINPSECQLIGYDEKKGPVGDLIIPEKIIRPDDKRVLNVVAVYESAFENCQSIGSVTFQGNPEVGSYAFRGSKVTGVNFGSKLTTLGNYAFANTPAMERVSIPGTLTDMGAYAFAGSGVKTVIIEDGVKTVGPYAFDGCKFLSEVRLPKGLTAINSNAFQNCSALKTISLPASLKSYSNVFQNSGLETAVLEEGMTLVDSYAFYNCRQLKTVTFPNTVSRIADYAFQGCSALTEITIPDSVLSLGSYVFQNCSALKEVVLPDSIPTLGSYFFQACSSLTEITIPDSVTSMGSYIFYNCTSLKSVRLSSQLTSIPYEAFWNCRSLEEIILPESVKTIETYAFEYCTKLSKVTLPKNLTSIGQLAFYNCRSLAGIEIPATVSSIGDSAFNGCTALKEIILPEKITYIPNSLFINCKAMESFVISSKVTGIGSSAFAGSGLKTITIPSTVKTINQGVFSNCTSLTEAILEASNVTVGANAFLGSTSLVRVVFQTGPISGITRGAIPNNAALKVSVPDEPATRIVRDSGIDPDKIYIGDQPSGLEPSEFTVDNMVYRVLASGTGESKVSIFTWKDGDAASLNIPSSVSYGAKTYQVTALGDSAFSGKSRLRSVTLPDTLEQIGNNVFSGCTSLQEVNLPQSLITIGSGMFSNCYALKKITVPGGVTVIGSSAFSGCRSLEEVNLPQSLRAIGSSAFSNCAALQEITIPDGVTSIGDYTFDNCTVLKSIVIPDRITGIGYASFRNCKNLSAIAYPSALTTIGNYAFYGCSGLTEVTFPKSLKSIGDRAFYTSGLLSVEIPEGVTTVNAYAFYSCKSLQSVSFPSTLQYIYEYAFQGCTQLEEITIPKSVSLIGYSAFQGCSSLKTADIKGYLPSGYYSAGYSYTNANVFAGCTALEKVTLSERAFIIVPNMFSGCTSLRSVDLLNDTSYIGSSAFQNCTSLASLAMPDTVSSIGSSAFQNCTALASVVLSKNLHSIPDSAFRNTAIRNITIPDSVTTLGNEIFRDCKELAWVKVGSGLQTIGLRAFPPAIQLIANDPRVQLLLVKYLNQDEDKRPAGEWNGKTNVAAGAIVAMNEDTAIAGSIKIEKGAEVTVLANVTVTGTLTIEGKLTIAAGGRLILQEGGAITGSGAKGLAISYPVLIPETDQGRITSPVPFAVAGEKITLTILPDNGCRLKPGSLYVNNTNITPGTEGTAVFTMPASTARIKAEFEKGLSIEGPWEEGIIEGASAVLRAVFPPGSNAAGATYEWTADDRIGAVSLAGADTAEVTVTANKVTDDIDVSLTVTATVKGTELTASRTIRIYATKPLRIKESFTTPFRPGEDVQLTALIGDTGAPAGAVIWSSRTPSVAVVDQDGKVTFRGAGTTLITAALARDPKVSVALELKSVIDAAGSLTFEGGGKAAYRAVEIRKNGEAFRNLYTDADGKFLIPALEQGSYEVFSTPYTQGYDTVTKKFTVKEGDSAAAWDISYTKCAAGSVRLLFTDTNGVPIPGVRAEIGCESPYQSAVRYSDAKGECLFDALTFAASGTPFTINYSTNDGGYGIERLIMKQGEAAKTVEVKLPVMSSISGRVTDLNGTGIAGLTVQVAGRSAMTGIDGAYAVRGYMAPVSYPVTIASWEKYFAAEQAPSAEVTEGSTVVVPDIKVLTGIDVTGRVLLDGRADNYKKAYVSLYNQAGTLIAGGYAAGDGAFSLYGAIRKTGNYRLAITQLYNMDGWYSVDYNTAPVSFTVSSLNQGRVALDLKAQSKLKTSEIFRGAGNTLTANTQTAPAGGKLELTAKFKNGSSDTVVAVFDTTLSGAQIDPAYSGGDYGKLQHIVTLKPGQSGSFLIKALTDQASIAAAAETKVTVNGQTSDFAKLSVDIANVTLSAENVSLKVGESFKVYGEAAKNSQVIVYGPDNLVLGTTAVGANAGRWYSMTLKGFDRAGVYTLRAEAKTGKETVSSAPIKLEVSENPIGISKVSVDTLAYDDLPVNSRVGVRSFSHMLNIALEPDPLCVRTLFTNDEEIKSVTYRFAGNSYQARRDSTGRWAADINDWRGTGLKNLTALVKAGKSELEFTVAEVTVLVDPSGHIADADTGLPVPGASVTCQARNGDGSYSLWDNEPHGQPANPWKTGQNGNYGWHVPDGVYRVDVSKDGYESMTSMELSKYSGGIEVPPPALDVNFNLIPSAPMSLLALTSKDSVITASFSRYLRSVTVEVQDETGNPLACMTRVEGSTVEITGEGFAGGKNYTVIFSDVLPKSGTKAEYSLAKASGTVLFRPIQPPVPGGNGSSAAENKPQTGGGIPANSAVNAQNRSGEEEERKTDTESILNQIISGLKLTPEAVRKAPRVNGSAVIEMTGSAPKTTGSVLIKALGTLETGETLTLNRKDKKLPYRVTIDPKSLTSQQKTINFGLTVGNKKVEKLFSKQYRNQFAVLELGQKGSYGFTAEITAKVNLKGINPKKLTAYSYNGKTNSYTRLANAAPYVDMDGNLRMRVLKGGIVVLSEGLLEKRSANPVPVIKNTGGKAGRVFPKEVEDFVNWFNRPRLQTSFEYFKIMY